MRKKPTTEQPEKPLRAFRPDPDLDRAMLRLQARDGMPFSVQIERAMRDYLTKQKVYNKKEKKR
jgi:hypothetical protein